MSFPLPPAENDPIIQLHDYYFQAANLMYEHVEKLFSLYEKKGRPSPKNVWKFQQYTKLWLATLYVVAEGFQSAEVKNHFQNSVINAKDNNDLNLRVHWYFIHHQIDQLGKQLR